MDQLHKKQEENLLDIKGKTHTHFFENADWLTLLTSGLANQYSQMLSSPPPPPRQIIFESAGSESLQVTRGLQVTDSQCCAKRCLIWKVSR